MEKKINSKALIISIIIALVCCAILFNYIKSLEKPTEESPKTNLIVASRNIAAGELITQAEINSIEISADSMPVGILNDREAIEGKYAKEPIIMGESFREERLATKEELSLSWNIPDSMRAVCVFVNEDSIFSNMLRVGDRVDVVGSFKSELEDKTIASTMIIIQNAEILQIGEQRVEQRNTNQMEEEGAEDTTKLPRTVTLAVKPEDAEKLVFASDFGDFSLIMRGHGDTETTKTKGILLEDVTPAILKLLNPLN